MRVIFIQEAIMWTFVWLKRVLCIFQFIIEDMKQQQTNKHSNLHREDQHITIEELWKGWKTSEGETEAPFTYENVWGKTTWDR